MNLSKKNIRPKHPQFFLLTFFSALVTISISFLASTPPISRDALTHHLYVPKLWLLNGSINPITYIKFSYFPMNLDLLYTIPLAFDNDIIPKYIHFAFALFTTYLVYDYLKKRLNTNYALFGSLFFLSLPIIVKLSITVYVDLGVIFFSTASFLMLLKWAEHKKLRHLILAGMFCGLAAGTKYNALITVFLLTALTPIIFIRLAKPQSQLKSLKGAGYALLFLGVTLFTFSPWMVRNYSETGNPIYPLYNSLFKTKASADSTSSGDSQTPTIISLAKDATKTITTRRSSTFAKRKALYHETWWQAMLLPARFFFEGQDDDPRYFDGKLNPFLLILMLFALYKPDYKPRTKREIYFLFTFGWLFFFLTFFQEALRIRYIATSIPAFIILATFGLHNIHGKIQQTQTSRNKAKLLTTLLVICTLGYNANYIIEQFNYLKPFSYIGGEVSRDEFIAEHRPEYPIQQYANEHLGPDTKILAIYGGKRGYYYDHPVIFEPEGKRFRLGKITKNSSTPREISQGLHQLGFTHLVIRLKLFAREANNNLSPEKITLLNKFLAQNTNLLAQNEYYGLFELK